MNGEEFATTYERGKMALITIIFKGISEFLIDIYLLCDKSSQGEKEKESKKRSIARGCHGTLGSRLTCFATDEQRSTMHYEQMGICRPFTFSLHDDQASCAIKSPDLQLSTAR